jgi:hypothetical protein
MSANGSPSREDLYAHWDRFGASPFSDELDTGRCPACAAVGDWTELDNDPGCYGADGGDPCTPEAFLRAPAIDMAEKAATRGLRTASLTSATTIKTERVHWVWEERIPRRAVVVVAGEKGLGKSTLTNAWIVAAVTRGELEGEFYGQPIDVAIATAEDDWRSIVKPRLIAHGADLARVHRLDLVDKDGSALMTLPDDVDLIAGAFTQLQATTGRRIGMLVIDPITAFLSPTLDSHKDASVRRALAPLASLAERLDLAVVVVAHLTKNENQRLLARVTGSGAFVNAARAVLAFARSPDDAEEMGNDWALRRDLACSQALQRVRESSRAMPFLRSSSAVWRTASSQSCSYEADRVNRIGRLAVVEWSSEGGKEGPCLSLPFASAVVSLKLVSLRGRNDRWACRCLARREFAQSRSGGRPPRCCPDGVQAAGARESVGRIGSRVTRGGSWS